MNLFKPIAIYARVSTARQEEEQTIQAQLTALKDFALNNGYRIIDQFTDEGWSGDVLARPALDKLRQQAKKKKWSAVLIYDPDRLARRYSYQELVMDELKEAGIEVLFVTVAAPKNPEDKILYGVRGIFAEYERMKITERFRIGKIRRVKEGNILVGQPLYGFNYILRKDDTPGYYEINEVEARVVRMIFSWVANEGYSTRKVAKRLQELNIRTKREKKAVWNPAFVGHLLRNKAYIGEWHFGARKFVVPIKPRRNEKYRRVLKSSSRIIPESKRLIVNIPAIINREVFDRAGEQLERNTTFSKRNQKREYLLSGLTWCVCGRRRYGEASVKEEKEYKYYTCSDKQLNYPLPSRCWQKGINVEMADRAVWNKVVELMSSDNLLTEQAGLWLAGQKKNGESEITDISIVNKELAKLKILQDRYMKAYGEGLVSLAQFSDYVLPIRAKIENLELQMSEIFRKVDVIKQFELADNHSITSFCQKVKGALPDIAFSTKQAIARRAIQKVMGTKESIKVVGYIPTADILELCRDSKYNEDIVKENEESLIKGNIPFEFTIDLGPIKPK